MAPRRCLTAVTRVLLAVSLLCAAAAVARAADRCAATLEPNATAEEIYNAGVCHEQSRAIGIAIRMFEELRRRYPKHLVAQRALVRLALLYESIAYFDRAADLNLEYARRYGGEKDAPIALNHAVVLYAALGRDREALRAIELFIKQYGRKRKGEAAEAMFFAASIIERQGDDQKLLMHLERYLKQFGNSGGRDRAAIAHARIGRILWESSCPLATTTRGCRKVIRARRRRAPRCDDSVVLTRAVARDKALATRARRSLTKAVRTLRPTRPASARQRQAVREVAAAELALLDQDFEDYLEIGFPAGLDFDPKKRALRDRSVKRFTAWLDRKREAASKLRKRYAAIARRPTPWARVAAARVGQMSADFRDQLMGSDIPRLARTGPYAAELREVYCDVLGDQAAPLEADAVAAFSRCAEIVGGAGDRWNALCRRQLSRLRPKKFPARLEVHGRANHIGPVLDRAGAVR